MRFIVYALTQDKDFLVPYRLARASLGPEIQKFLLLTQDNVTQQNRMKQVQASSAQWLRYSNEVIESTRQGHGPMPWSVLGKKIIDSVLANLEEIVKTESVLKQSRIEDSRTSRVSGMGLGLYIVRLIVESHGGVVSAESEEGRGSTFTVRVPLSEVQTRAA
jgi:CHASE3 domain sensor protein